MRLRELRIDMLRRRGGTNCVQVGRALQRYLDGTLDDAARARVAAHLAACRRCGLDEQTYRDMTAALLRRRPTDDTEPIARLRAFAASITLPLDE